MVRWKFNFSMSPGVLVYLQNNSSWYGDHISSTILSCNIGIDEAMDRVRKLEKYLAKKSDKPVKWADVMKRTALFEESYKDEQAGDLLRDDCREVSSFEMDGGFIFGGSDGTKYVNKPKIERVEKEDATIRWSKPVSVITCTYENGHKCSTSSGRDTIEKLKTMQSTIQDLFITSELKKWKKDPTKKAKEIVEELDKLLS